MVLTTKICNQGFRANYSSFQ